MREQLQQRLHELKAEYAAGQKMMTDLEAQRANLRDSLLRISGAIQVLEEELAKAPSTSHDLKGCVPTHEEMPTSREKDD